MDSVVTMVDGEALAAGSVVGDAAAVERQRQADPELEHLTSLETLLADQLHSADLVLVSRADKLSAAEMAAVEARIHPHMRPGAPVLPSRHGVVPPELLLGLDRDAEEDPGWTSSPRHPAGHDHHRHDHPHVHDDHHGDHHHAPVTSAVVKLDGVWDRQTLEALLRQQFTAMGLLRAKGYAAIAGKSLPLMIQAVGPRLETWYQARSDYRGGLTLVLIGLAVDPAPLRTALTDLRLRLHDPVCPGTEAPHLPCNAMESLRETVAYVIAYGVSPALVLGFFLIGPFAVGKVAHAKGHNPLSWGLASILITPILGATLVAGLPDRHLHKKLDRIISRQPPWE